MVFVVLLRGIGQTIEVLVPSKPVETENKNHYEVIIKRGDGTLDRVYRFDKINVISIREV
jgi:hypothetical protein